MNDANKQLGQGTWFDFHDQYMRRAASSLELLFVSIILALLSFIFLIEV